jgi:uncharacterized RDD family membrane protein YckC
MTTITPTARARAHQGQRAGLVSRLAADLIDIVLVLVLGVVLLALVAGVRALFSHGFDFLTIPQPGRGSAAGALLLVYLWFGWGLNGRTVGKMALGLRAVRADGGDLSPSRAFARALLYILFPVGFLWVAVSGRNASVQDLLLRTAVVHDWGTRHIEV